MYTLRIIEYGSCDYQDMVSMRDNVLRRPLGLTFTQKQLQQEINDVLIGCFNTAADKSELIGCCILTPVDEDTVQLRQMAVTPPLQKKGIGSKLLAFAEDQARNDGFHTLMMHARKPVVSFYQHQGYIITGDEFNEAGVPHYKMSKALQEPE